MRLVLLALSAGAAGFACGPTSADPVPGGSDPPADPVYSVYDLEYQWRGISEPLRPFDRPLELTLGFDAYGTGSNAVALTRYTFPSPLDPDEIVEYHTLIDTYDLFLYEDGRFILDTEYDYAVGSVFVEEKVYKELRMNEARDRMEGFETIHVFENGQLTIVYEGWLTLDRLP